MDERVAWWKKLLLLALILSFCGFIFSITETGLKWYQSQVDKNPQGKYAKWGQWKIYQIYNLRLDYLVAANTLHRFCELYPDDEQVPFALYRMAQLYKDAEYAGTCIRVYQFLIKNYPESEWAKKGEEERQKTLAQFQVPSTRRDLPEELRPAEFLTFAK